MNVSIARELPMCGVGPDGKVVVAGGMIDKRPLRSVEILDPETGRWRLTNIEMTFHLKIIFRVLLNEMPASEMTASSVKSVKVFWVKRLENMRQVTREANFVNRAFE